MVQDVHPNFGPLNRDSELHESNVEGTNQKFLRHAAQNGASNHPKSPIAKMISCDEKFFCKKSTTMRDQRN